MQTGGAFGVNQFAVFGDFKDAATGAHQLHISAWKFLFDPRLQLESPGSVASGITVFDAYMHPSSPCAVAAYERTTIDARSVAGEVAAWIAWEVLRQDEVGIATIGDFSQTCQHRKSAKNPA
jgi:hypothetical protein